MQTESRLAKFSPLASSWEEMAPSALVDFRLGRKRHGFGGFREEIDPQSATKRDAVQFRRYWGPLGTLKARFGPAELQTRARAAGVFFVFPLGITRQFKTQPVAAEVFRGRVDDILDGTVVATLFSENGEPMTVQWPEQDLAKESIGKGDLFELTMTDTGGAVLPSFRKVARKPIPDDLWNEIEKVKAAYSDPQADDLDGEEEV